MTNVVNIGGVSIGGGNRVAIQSMTNIPVIDIDSTLLQILQLTDAGCDIVRVAVPDMASARALAVVKNNIHIPIVADIHFDYKLAIACVEGGADKVRINPGNIGLANMPEVVDCIKAHDIAVRIGVNCGSLDKQMLANCNGDKVAARGQSLMHYVERFGGYDNIVLSVKSSSVSDTIRANRLISKACQCPIHIGVTESGVGGVAIAKSAIGIGSLLADGIGDTIRVSLTADPVAEVRTARDILSALSHSGVQFVSCPKCGRCSYDLEGVASRVYDHVKDMDIDLKVAVMGCEVNGPGECADADIGMAGGKGRVAFFNKGKVYRTVDSDMAEVQFIEEIDKIYRDITSNKR